MTVKEKQKRDTKIFNMKLGINGEQPHTYEELAKKFDLSFPQVFRNVIKKGIQLVEILENDTVPLLPYQPSELDVIREKFTRYYQKQKLGS